MTKKSDVVEVEARLLMDVQQLQGASVALLDTVFQRVVRGGVARQLTPELERIHQESERLHRAINALLSMAKAAPVEELNSEEGLDPES